MKAIVSALSLVFSFTAAATNQPPDFDKAKWDGLLEKVVKTGAVMTIDSGELRYLSNVYPADTSVPHSASYFSVLGNYNPRAEYEMSDASAVYEDWKLDTAGNWVVDQWKCHMSLAGDLVEMDHVQFIEKNGQILDFKDLDAGAPTEAANLARMAKWVADWEAAP